MMKKHESFIQEECYLILLRNSLKSIPFNLLVATVISAYMFYSQIPKGILLIWYTVIFFLSLIRWLNSKSTLNGENYRSQKKRIQNRFIALTFLMGAAWSSAYFIFLSYVNVLSETVIVLVLGGMAAGSMASLAICLSAYYAFLFPMFLPLIVYNFYVYNIDGFVLGATFFLFVTMLVITAKMTSNLLRNTIRLTKEKDELIVKLENSLDEIKVISITDALTGLYNRRYFDSQLKVECARAKRNAHFLNLVFIDVDNFKSINDNYGHPYGDAFLIYVAQIIKQKTRRANDAIFRIGGDEFAAIFINTSLDNVVKTFTSIQHDIKRQTNYINVSLSIGIISIPPTCGKKVDDLIGVADKTLYQAKKGGKSQIVSTDMNSFFH